MQNNKSQRKPIFFTADWHVGHANSIVFDERPFKDLEHMHKVLINNYNAIVPENGICYFLGDMGLCNVEILKTIMDQLNGTKVLIMGNHDKGVNAMYNIGFDVVTYGMKMLIAGKVVTLSHCPLVGIPRENTEGMRNSPNGENWHGEARRKHSVLTFPDFGDFHYHLHGHIHSRKGRDKSIPFTNKQFDVGVPANDYRPVAISKIESWIARNEQDKSTCPFCTSKCSNEWCSYTKGKNE